MINDLDKAALNKALTQLKTSLDTIQDIRDRLSEEDEDKLGTHFGLIEHHGTEAEKFGAALWKEVE